MDLRLALCRQDEDPERWFPISRFAADMDPYPVAVCNLCPLQRECLDRALKFGFTQGTWGGLTEWERKPLHVAHPPVAQFHQEEEGSEPQVRVG